MTIIIVFVWLGMIIGISFLEAPLKFKAPGITRALGVGIGQLVFQTLYKIEIVFALLVVGFVNYTKIGKVVIGYLLPLIIVLLLQTIWLLPFMDDRATQLINGVEIKDTYHHYVYIFLEVNKAFLLLKLGQRILTLFDLK